MSDARQITGPELVTQLARMSRRLTAHLDRVDAGELDYLDDVSSLTRSLLAMGTGDKGILRLVRQEHLEMPTLSVGAPLPPRPGLLLGVHSVPTDNPPGQLDGTVTVALDKWISATAIEMPQARNKRISWSGLIADFGNTFGAHLSQTIPRVLEETQTHNLSGRSLADHLRRASGVVAERLLAEVLPPVGEADSARIEPRRMSTSPVRFGGLLLYSGNAQGYGALIDFWSSEAGSFDLLDVHLPGVEMAFRVNFEVPGAPAVELTLVSEA